MGLESRDSVSLRKKTVRSWSSNVIVQTVLTALLRWLSWAGLSVCWYRCTKSTVNYIHGTVRKRYRSAAVEPWDCPTLAHFHWLTVQP